MKKYYTFEELQQMYIDNKIKLKDVFIKPK